MQNRSAKSAACLCVCVCPQEDSEGAGEDDMGTVTEDTLTESLGELVTETSGSAVPFVVLSWVLASQYTVPNLLCQ